MATKTGGRGGPLNKAVREKLKVEAWTYAAQGHSCSRIAQVLGVNEHTAGRWISEMSRRQREILDQRGYDATQALLASTDMVKSEAWSAVAMVHHALEREQRRRDAINAERKAQGKQPIAAADWDLPPALATVLTQALRMVNDQTKLSAEILGVLNKGKRAEDDAAGQQVIDRLQELMREPLPPLPAPGDGEHEPIPAVFLEDDAPEEVPCLPAPKQPQPMPPMTRISAEESMEVMKEDAGAVDEDTRLAEEMVARIMKKQGLG